MRTIVLLPGIIFSLFIISGCIEDPTVDVINPSLTIRLDIENYSDGVYVINLPIPTIENDIMRIGEPLPCLDDLYIKNDVNANIQYMRNGSIYYLEVVATDNFVTIELDDKYNRGEAHIEHFSKLSSDLMFASKGNHSLVVEYSIVYMDGETVYEWYLPRGAMKLGWQITPFEFDTWDLD